MDDSEVRERVARVGTLLDEIEALADPTARTTAAEAVQTLLELYGEGLARMLDLALAQDETRPGGESVVDAFAADELVSHLLLLHGLHPLPIEERIERALEEVRPYLGSHGGDIEFLGVDDGVARLRFQGSCHGCPSSAATLKLAIEDAIQRAAPDLEGLDVEGVTEAPAPQPLLFVDTSIDAAAPRAEQQGTSWVVAGGLAQLSGGVSIREVAGEPLLFIGIEDALYAYRPNCPGCGASLAEATLDETQLACASCGLRYEVRGGGRCLNDAARFLEPAPLLISGQGVVKVALSAVAV